ncbi:unnamed protein product [Amaranthus hypochondriacus]
MESESEFELKSGVPIPKEKPFVNILQANIKETFFPDDPFRKLRKQPLFRRLLLIIQYFVPILEWAPRYNLKLFKSDLIAGITIASLAVPQGISYANLASLPPLIGLYSSVVPPLIYAIMGSSRDLAIGTIAVASLLFSDTLGKVVSPTDHPTEYLQLAFTTTFIAGFIQTTFGVLRLGFIVDLLSHATILGFMGGVATKVCLEQLKTILGLQHFPHKTNFITLLTNLFSRFHEWKWQTAILACGFIIFMVLTKYYSKRKAGMFWISAMAPLISVIVGSLIVFLTHADKHGVPVIGLLKKGLNPLSFNDLAFKSPHLSAVIKTAAVTTIIGLAEGVAVGRSFAMRKNYHIDGNKEMLAFGLMNIVGSCTSCYLTTGIFSRTAVNFSAGCKSVASNIVMSITVMITLLVLIPLFRYTPYVVLSSIIVNAMLGLIKFHKVFELWKIDKFDFVICIGAYFGVVFGSVDNGLIIAICLSLVRLLLVAARPKTMMLGNIPNTTSYRSIEHYNFAQKIVGLLILQIEGPINFICTNYLRERIMRWVYEEEDRTKSCGEQPLQHVILDLGAVGSIDTSGISLLKEVKKLTEARKLKLYLANPGSELVKKMHCSECIEIIGEEYIHPTVSEAVKACSFMPQAHDSIDVISGNDEQAARVYNV